MAARKQKLSDSLRLQQLFRDVEDEETWIREKEPIAASSNRGKTNYLLSSSILPHQINTMAFAVGMLIKIQFTLNWGFTEMKIFVRN